MQQTWKDVVDRWTARMRANGHEPTTMVSEIRAVADKPGDFHVNDPERGAWWQRMARAKYPVINWDHTIGGLVMGGGGYAVSRTSVDFPYVASGAKDTAQMLARHRGDAGALAAVLIMASNEGLGWSGRRPFHMEMLAHMASARLGADGTSLHSGGNQGDFLLLHGKLADSLQWEEVVDSLADEHSANLDQWAPVWFSTWRQDAKGYHRVNETEIDEGWSDSMGRMMSGMWGEDEGDQAEAPKAGKSPKGAEPAPTWDGHYTSDEADVTGHRLVGEAITALGRDPNRYGRVSGIINQSELRVRVPTSRVAKKTVWSSIQITREAYPLDAPEAAVAITLRPQDGALTDADMNALRTFLVALDASVTAMTAAAESGIDPYALDLSDYVVEPLVARLLQHLGTSVEEAVSVGRDRFGRGDAALAPYAWVRIPGEEARHAGHGRKRPTRLKVAIEGDRIRCVKSTLACPVHGSLRIVREDGVTTVRVPTDVSAKRGHELADALRCPALDGLAGVLVAEDVTNGDGTLWNGGTLIRLMDEPTVGDDE